MALAEMEKHPTQVTFEAIERAKERLADAEAAVVAERAALEYLRALFAEQSHPETPGVT